MEEKRDDNRQQPRGIRNCNPLNIRKSADRYKGEVIPSQDGAFKQFETMAYGYRAAMKILHTYYHKRGLKSVRKMVERWAPKTENHTERYVQMVHQVSGLPTDGEIPFEHDTIVPMVQAMAKVECGVTGRLVDIEKGWEMLLNTL